MLAARSREGRGQRVGHEEAIPEKRAFEDEVDQRVEQVPDEQDAGFQRHGLG